jgi:hypothetical protein
MRRKLPLLLPFSLFLVALGNGCATDASTSGAPGGEHAPITGLPPSVEKLVTRNNAASLLFQLVEDEKNVSVLLIVKGNQPEVNSLVKAIAVTAGEASKNLTALAKADPALNLHAIDLPDGEVAARAAIAKTKTHELLLDTGNNFEFALLLTQADALSYGYNLAQIAANDSSNPEEKRTFATLGETMKAQYQQVIAFIRAPAPAK